MKWLAAFMAAAALAASPAVGEQQVLVILATWGPQPWTRDQVTAAFADADRLYRKSSFDQLKLRADVTPWLTGYAAQPDCPPPEHERIPTPLTNGPDAAAEAAGFHVGSYDRVVYIVPKTACNWLGVGVGRQVMLNGSMDTYGFVHELGHTYGLAHAHGRLCRACQKREYGDPFSPMGSGLVDFSAYEKVQLGWFRETVRLTRRGTYPLGRPDVLGATPYAAVVETAATAYWFEQRLDIAQPGLIARTIEPDVPDDDLAPSTLFIGEPTAREGTTVARGQTFRVPGVFSLQYGGGVRFAWLDRKRPAPPEVSVGGGRVTWSARDGGSGIESCRVRLDGRTIASGMAKGSATLPMLTSGTHRVSVACVDRAGNRSRATVKRLRVR